MNNGPDMLKEMTVPSELDAKILAVARLSAAGNRRRHWHNKMIAASSIAAVCAVGFALFMVPGKTDTRVDMKYYALNDLTSIEQETFALTSALNSNSVYMSENSISLENF